MCVYNQSKKPFASQVQNSICCENSAALKLKSTQNFFELNSNQCTSMRALKLSLFHVNKMKNFVADTKTCISGLSKVPKRDCVARTCVDVSSSARKIP